MSVEHGLRERIQECSCPEPNTGCWLWLGCDAGEGYGALSIKNKSFKAHRVSYAAFVGPLPHDACVCHRCDTPACVNPEHKVTALLFLLASGLRACNSAC